MKRGIAPLIKRTVSYNFNYFLDSMNSINTTNSLTALFQNARWISRDDGVRRNVFGDHAAGADDGILADGEAAKDGSVGADGGAFFDYYGHDLPVGFGLQTAAGGCGPGVAIVDEHDTVADEDLVLDGHPLADEGVALDLAVSADGGVFLDFDEGTDFGAIANRAAV